ncbi:MAG: hypothetical protein JXA42_13235, partial [Anaerolineales bacterium]|nr:hypothetical protein [Anaerolineales bacterium]
MYDRQWLGRCIHIFCTAGLLANLALPAALPVQAGRVPPPTWIPPVAATYGGADQATLSGPLGLQVNLYDLSLTAQRTDLFITGCSLPLEATFQYKLAWRSAGGSSPFGVGWRLRYQASYLELTDGRVLVTLVNGSIVDLRPGEEGLSRLEPGRYLYSDPDGLTYIFDDPSHRQVTKLQDRMGGYLLFSYNDLGQLTRLEDRYNRRLDLAYTAGRLSQVTEANATPVRQVRYEYDARGLLV